MMIHVGFFMRLPDSIRFRCQVPIGPLAQHTRFDGGAAVGFGLLVRVHRFHRCHFDPTFGVEHNIKTYQNILVTISKRLQTYQNICSNMKFTMFLVYSKVYWVAMNLLRPCYEFLTVLTATVRHRQEWFDVSSKAGKLGKSTRKMAVDPPFFMGKSTISMEDRGGFCWHIELWLIFRRRGCSMAFEV